MRREIPARVYGEDTIAFFQVKAKFPVEEIRRDGGSTSEKTTTGSENVLRH